MSTRTSLIAAVLSIVGVASARSQAPLTEASTAAAVAAAPLPTTNCSDTTLAADFAQCGLWMDGRVLRQGNVRREVSRRRFLHPMAMSPFVVGDSARYYALAYEHDARVARNLYVIAAGMTLGAFAVHGFYRCGRRYQVGGCSSPDDMYGVTAGAFMLGSLACMVAEVPFLHSASIYASQALWWHNSRLRSRWDSER